MEIMLDLETLGTTPGSVILSIGAAAFDLHKGYQGRSFHKLILVQPQLDAGMTVSASTLAWWMEQSDEARFALKPSDRLECWHPVNVLSAFDEWFHQTSINEGVWGHGLNFDIPILEALYTKFGPLQKKAPWKYNTGRDTRTLFDLAGKKMGDFGTPNPLAHSAVHDAIYQADETAKCVNFLRGQRVEASRMREPVAATAGDI